MTKDELMDIAGRWYLTLEEDGADEQIMAQFNDWVERDAANRRAFDSVVEFWSHFDSMPEIQAMQEAGPAVKEGAFPTRHEHNIVKITQKKPVDKPARWGLGLRNFSIAAAILLICSAMVNFYINYLPEGTYHTSTGEQQIVHMSDGTVVYLNTNTKIRMEYSDNIRKVSLLAGEARFEVATDKDRPFIVATTRGDVRAVGTSFNIYDRDEAVEIIVFEGTIEVNHKRNRLEKPVDGNRTTRKAVLVTDGERIVALEDRLTTIRAANELEIIQKNAWRNGKLIFRGQRLSAVIEEMARYSHKKIIITDDSLHDMKLGGAFDIEDFDALLHAIEDTFPVKIIRFTPYIALITEA